MKFIEMNFTLHHMISKKNELQKVLLLFTPIRCIILAHCLIVSLAIKRSNIATYWPGRIDLGGYGLSVVENNSLKEGKIVRFVNVLLALCHLRI